jgi:cytochrome c oxidase subunit II
MKTLLKLAAVAAAFGMVPAAAGAQQPAGAAPQAAASQPDQASNTTVAIAGEEPGNVQVAQAATPPDPAIGQPTGHVGLQPQVTELGRDLAWFHNDLLMPIITAISIFVLALLLFVVVRFRRGAHPAPSRTTHNTTLEVVWTLVPVLILVVIALPSIDLLRAQYSPPAADLTVKAIGNQWNWTYEYPDHGITFDSYMLKEAGHTEGKERARTDADGPRLLAVDERMVVPVGATVKVIVTAADVVHSWGVPAFWVKIDAVPGRLNETWFKAEKTGVYYGQCFELCGARHAYMPIAVEVVEPARFAAWVASKGGKMPGAAPPSPDATATSPISNPAAGGPAPGGSEATPEPTLTPGAATPAVTNQAAESSRGNP